MPPRAIVPLRDPLLLAVDFGTQSVRAVLFDASGHLVARAQRAIESHRSPGPGWAEHDPGYLWDALAATCRALWEEPGADRARVAAMALTTQRNTVLCLDGDGAPLRPAIVWLDRRRMERLPPLSFPWRVAMAAAGMRGTIAHLRRQSESLWLREHEPDVWRRTATFCFLSGFLSLRLTGRRADSVGCQVGYVPFDYRRQRWASPRDWRWRALGIAPSQLMELVPVGDRIGAITADAARATGIPAGTPLVATAADAACDVLGVGAVTPDVAALSYGTTATVNVTHRRWVTPFPFLPAYPSALPGAYGAEVQVARGFWMVRWFLDQFGHPERERAAALGVAPETLLDELAESVPPGSDGLLLQPYWSPGVRQPGPEARGAVVGFTDVHTRAHLYRAILEGIAYALREGTERLERRGGVPVVALRVAGGGSRSDVAMQLTADIFDRPATRAELLDTAALGAAIIAAASLGIHPDVPTAARAMTRMERTFLPDPERARIYDALYRRVYRKLYGRLRPLYARLASIGRPAA
ncbi:MAG: FGGY-family carbohydrate kinase [Gemmatimonadaceae bacterium]